MLNAYQLRLQYKNEYRLKVASFFFWTPCIMKSEHLLVRGIVENAIKSYNVYKVIVVLHIYNKSLGIR